jgi:chromosome segregation ATPase
MYTYIHTYIHISIHALKFRWTDERQQLRQHVAELRQKHAAATEATTRAAAALTKKDETISELKERLQHLKSAKGSVLDEQAQLGARVSLLQDSLRQFSSTRGQHKSRTRTTSHGTDYMYGGKRHVIHFSFSPAGL